MLSSPILSAFFGRHGVDVFGQNIFDVLYLGIVFVAWKFLFQFAEVDESPLAVCYGIVVNIGCVTGI